MNYPVAFSKRWFLLITLLMHSIIMILLLQVPQRSILPSPAVHLDLRAGLRAGSNSFNPETPMEKAKDKSTGKNQETSPTKNVERSKNNMSLATKKSVQIADSHDLAANGGYLYSKSSGGKSLINKSGSLSVPATAHDTIYSNYCAKMIWHLQSTTRHMQAINFLLKRISGIKTARVRLVIARDGSLLESGLITSCGLDELDQLMLKAINTAHPYPPLPNYFPSNTFIYDGWFSIEGLK